MNEQFSDLIEAINSISSPKDLLNMRSTINARFPNDRAYSLIDDFNQTGTEEEKQKVRQSFHELVNQQYNQPLTALNDRLMTLFPDVNDLKRGLEALSETDQTEFLIWWSTVNGELSGS